MMLLEETLHDIELPAEAARSTTARAASLSPQNLEAARILIVDDESVNVEVVQAHLEIEGFFNLDATTDAAVRSRWCDPAAPISCFWTFTCPR